MCSLHFSVASLYPLCSAELAVLPLCTCPLCSAELAMTYFDLISRASNDTGLSVRKRAVKVRGHASHLPTH